MLMSTEDTMPNRSDESSSQSEEFAIELPESSMNDETTILPAVKERREPTNGRYNLAASAGPRADVPAGPQASAGRIRSRLALAAKATLIVLVVLAWVSALLLAIRSI